MANARLALADERLAERAAPGDAGGRRGRAAADMPGAATDGRVFARGLVNYPADDLRRIAGLRTERIAEVLGAIPYEEVVHRDNLAVIDRSESPDRQCSRNS